MIPPSPSYYTTSGSAVAKRPRDDSCLSVVSFNSTKRRTVKYDAGGFTELSVVQPGVQMQETSNVMTVSFLLNLYRYRYVAELL